MDEAYDIDGRRIRIGDVVEWYSQTREVEYTFTVDEIQGSDIWGEDIPHEAYYGIAAPTGIFVPQDREKNWHSGDWSKVIGKKERKSWEGSTIKFKFI